MANSNQTFIAGAVWIGLIFHLAGAAILYQVWASDSFSSNAPAWVVVAFGVMFFNAGFVVSLMDSGFNSVRERAWFSYFHAATLLSIPLSFFGILNWVAFGPGEREFSGGIAIPFVAIDFGSVNQIFGRIVFGIPALLFDVVVVYIIYEGVKTVFQKWRSR